MDRKGTTKIARRWFSLGLAGIMTFLCVLPCGAAQVIGDGVTPLFDEAYYATTDYYGNLTDASVVKSYITNGVDSITDYGVYDQVNNLTDSTAPTTQDGRIVFQFDQDPGHFYFEGKTQQPFEQLPWTLAVHYSLNGLPAKAEDLAGAAGVVEITVDAIPNENASTYAKNNYTLEAMAIFNQDDILSLEAPGAQVQLIGNLRAVLFLGLPGEECHFTIRVGSEDFSFGGMTFLMVPATLSQLEEIAKLSERKDDLEEDYNKLSDSLDVLLDSLWNMSSSLYASAKGLDQLNQARGTISGGKDKVYAAADALRGDLDGIAAVLQPVSEQIDAASAAVSDSKTVLTALNGEVNTLKDDLKKLQSLIDDIQDHQGDFEDLFDHTVAMKNDLRDLESALNAAKKSKLSPIDPLFGGMSSEELSAALTQAKGLNTYYTKLGGTAMTESAFVQYALKAAGKSEAEISAVVSGHQKYSTCTTQAEVQSQATQDVLTAGLTDQGEITAYVTQAVTLWATYNTVAGAYRTAKGSEAQFSFQDFLYANLLLKPEEYPTSKETAQNLYELWQLNDADEGLAKILIMEADSLNSKLDSLNDTMDSAKDTLDDILAPTAEVAGQLSQLCKDLDELDDLLDTADDFGDLGRSTAKKLSAVLDQADALYQVLDGYEPQLQASLTTVKELSVSAADTVKDTVVFMTDLEDLMKTSGKQLDAGTKQTLEGLAEVLRSAARSMSKTNDVKSAKNNISSIIEDTWDEYTGDVNNLLLMDATAQAQSLTDSRNGSPTSIQVLIRTQEIKADEGEQQQIDAPSTPQTTFWGRVVQMFKDLWAAVTGIFHRG